jgi:hypothetical protein
MGESMNPQEETIPYYCRECCPARNGGDLKNCGHESVFRKSLKECQDHHSYHTEEYEIKIRNHPLPKITTGYVYPDGCREGYKTRS